MKIKSKKNLNKKSIFLKNYNKKNILETNGPKGPDPTRYGDWEIKGRSIDF